MSGTKILDNHYSKYKDSGNPSIGEIPAHWETKRVKHCFEFLDHKRVPLSSEERGKLQGEYPYYGASGVIDHIDDYIFDEPLILVGEDGANLLMRSSPLAFIATGKYWVNNHAHVLKPRSGNIDYLCYLLEMLDYTTLVTGAAQPKLTNENLGSIVLCYPPIAEQHEIANFLNHEVGKIDELISELEILIELTIEKQQVFISSAVTKGLNSDEETLVPSGFEWIGEVPKRWNLELVRRLFQEVDERSMTGEEELMSVSHITGVTPRSEKNVNMFEAESLEGYKVCQPGDLVINTLWAWMGAMGVAFQKGIVSPAYHVYRPQGDYDPRYINYLVRLPNFAKEVTRYSKGVWSSRLRLYPDEFFKIVLPVPPIEEQREIVAFLDAETAKLDELSKAAEETIQLLQERRSALIAATVTGKIRVTE